MTGAGKGGGVGGRAGAADRIGKDPGGADIGNGSKGEAVSPTGAGEAGPRDEGVAASRIAGRRFSCRASALPDVVASMLCMFSSICPTASIFSVGRAGSVFCEAGLGTAG